VTCLINCNNIKTYSFS